MEPRRAWANLLFMRLGMVGFSLLTLCMLELDNQNDLEHGRVSALDHSSIAALARNLLEAWIMFVYMSEPAISDDEWSLRRSILELHDSTARYRIAKDIGDAEEAQNFKLAKDATKRQIISDPLFQTLDGERQEKSPPGVGAGTGG